jgi:hypothetical protein
MKTMPALGIAGHLQGGGHEGFNHLFQGRRIPARFFFKPVEQSQTLVIRGYRPAENDGFQKGFFGVKVIMDRSQIHARLGNDAAQGSSGVALCRQTTVRRYRGCAPWCGSQAFKSNV